MGTPCALLGDPAGGPMMTLQYTVIVCGRPAVVASARTALIMASRHVSVRASAQEFQMPDA